jgi:hypothetical protein
MANCPIKSGVKKSIVKPTPHKMNRRGGGTNADTVQMVADTAKSIRVPFCQWPSRRNTIPDAGILNN